MDCTGADAGAAVLDDGAAGLSFLIGTLALPFTDSKKHRNLAFRLYGVASYIGIGLLAYSGYHNNGTFSSAASLATM